MAVVNARERLPLMSLPRPWLLPADVNDDGPLPRTIQLH